jgi:hypothetical protein
MPSFGGLISGVMGRAAEGYGKAADMEMRKQGELDLKKQLMEVESEKRLREDEIKRGRDVSDRITEETRIRSPEYLAAQAKADADKFKALVAAGVPEAEAQATVAKGKAAAGVRKDLALVNVEADTAEYNAKKPLDTTKAADAVTAKIAEAGSLAGDPNYLTNVAKLATAAKDPDIKMTQIRADAVKDRPTSGGAGKITVRSTYTNSDGNKVAVMSDSSERVLGKSSDYDKTVSNLVTKMAKDDYKFAKLPEAEKRKQAEARLRGQLSAPSSGPKDLSKYERDKALND